MSKVSKVVRFQIPIIYCSETIIYHFLFQKLVYSKFKRYPNINEIVKTVSENRFSFNSILNTDLQKGAKKKFDLM